MRKIFDFHGGIHPPENKLQSLGKSIASAGIPAELTLPLSQHIGAPASPVVAVGDRGDVVVGARGRHARGGARAGANARGKIGAELGGDVEGRLRARHRAGRGHRKHRNGRDEAAGCAAGIRALLSSRHSPWPVPSADTIAHPRKDPSSIGYRCTDATYWRVRLCPPGARGGRRKGNCRRKVRGPVVTGVCRHLRLLPIR